MDNLSLQYIAGFFDGEGSIGIYSTNSGTCYSLRTQLTQNDSFATRFVIGKLHEIYGGNFSKIRSSNGNSYYNWQLNTTKAVKFLEDILPYLVLKKAQAEIAIIWQKQKPQPTRNSKGQICAASGKNLKKDKKGS